MLFRSTGRGLLRSGVLTRCALHTGHGTRPRGILSGIALPGLRRREGDGPARGGRRRRTGVAWLTGATDGNRDHDNERHQSEYADTVRDAETADHTIADPGDITCL